MESCTVAEGGLEVASEVLPLIIELLPWLLAKLACRDVELPAGIVFATRTLRRAAFNCNFCETYAGLLLSAVSIACSLVELGKPEN